MHFKACYTKLEHFTCRKVKEIIKECHAFFKTASNLKLRYKKLKNLNSLKPHINETENRLKVRNYGLFQQKMQTQNGRGIVRTWSCWPKLLRSLKALLYPDFSLYKLRVNRRTMEIQQPPYILMLNYSFKRFLQVRISQVLIRSFFSHFMSYFTTLPLLGKCA